MSVGNESAIMQEGTLNILENFQRYYTPILVHFGLLGNCLSVCVFFGTKLRYFSSSIYLGALAISDTVFLVIVFIAWLNQIKMVDLFNWWGFNQFFIYVTTLCSFLSVWLIIAFTVERYVAVRWPLRRQSLCTVTRAKTVVISLTVLAIPVCSPVILFSTSENENTKCDLDKDWESWANVYNIFDTILTFALPLTMIVTFNTLIARNIYKLDHVRRTLTIESNASTDKAQSPRDRMPQTKVTKMLLLVSSTFFCLYTPSYVCRVIAFLYECHYPPPWLILVQQMCNLLFNTSFGINFVFYCASGQNFRRAMVRMFIKRSNTRRNGTLMQMTSHGKQYEFTHRCNSAKQSNQDQLDNAQQNCQEMQNLTINKEL